MENKLYTKEDVIEKTKTAINLFIRKQNVPFMEMLDPDFVWIGDYEPLYMKGIPAFYESVKDELQELPVDITEEEYSLLSHEKSLWVTYGRFKATTNDISSKIHFTFVWKESNSELRLIHANASHANPMPQVNAKSKIFKTPSRTRQALDDLEEKRICLQDLDGTTHYLIADEIYFIKANNNVCDIHARSGTFTCRITLKELVTEPFFQIHRSYLVNIEYIKEIHRYTAKLKNGVELPIGKERYMNLKQLLKKIGSIK